MFLRPNQRKNVFKQRVCNNGFLPIFRILVDLDEINHTADIRMIEILDRPDDFVRDFDGFAFYDVLDERENLGFG
jgi:hypothetical protein